MKEPIRDCDLSFSLPQEPESESHKADTRESQDVRETDGRADGKTDGDGMAEVDGPRSESEGKDESLQLAADGGIAGEDDGETLAARMAEPNANYLRPGELRILARAAANGAYLTDAERREIGQSVVAVVRRSRRPRTIFGAARTAADLDRAALATAQLEVDCFRAESEARKVGGPAVNVQVNVEGRLAGLIEAAERRAGGENCSK